jgi:hypothetical protein
MLRSETGRTLGAFIFEEILCRWGAVEEIVTDNGTAYIALLPRARQQNIPKKEGFQHGGCATFWRKACHVLGERSLASDEMMME